MLKNAPNQADNFVNFSVMKATKNQLFGSFAGSDLQAKKESDFFLPVLRFFILRSFLRSIEITIRLIKPLKCQMFNQ